MFGPKYNSTTNRPTLGPSGRPGMDCTCCTPIEPPPVTKGCVACCDGTPQVFEVDFTGVSGLGPGIKAPFYYGFGNGLYCIPQPYGTTQVLLCPYGDGPLYPENSVCTYPRTGPLKYPTDNPRLRWNGSLGKYDIPIVTANCSSDTPGYCKWAADIQLPPEWVEFKSYITNGWVQAAQVVLSIWIIAVPGPPSATNASWQMYATIYASPPPAHVPPPIVCFKQSLQLDILNYTNDSVTRGVCTDNISFSVPPQELPPGSGNWQSADYGLSGTVIARPKQIAQPCPCPVVTIPCDNTTCASCPGTIVVTISYPSGGATVWYEGNGLVNYSTGCTWFWPGLPNTLYCSGGYWYLDLYDDPMGTTLVLRARAPNVDGCPMSSAWEILVNLSSSTPIISTWAL